MDGIIRYYEPLTLDGLSAFPSSPESLYVAGGNQMLASANMGGQKVVNMADGVLPTDGATVAQLPVIPTIPVCLKVDGTNSMLADANIGNHKLTNVANAVLPTDAPNLAQVQALVPTPASYRPLFANSYCRGILLPSTGTNNYRILYPSINLDALTLGFNARLDPHDMVVSAVTLLQGDQPKGLYFRFNKVLNGANTVQAVGRGGLYDANLNLVASTTTLTTNGVAQADNYFIEFYPAYTVTTSGYYIMGLWIDTYINDPTPPGNYWYTTTTCNQSDLLSSAASTIKFWRQCGIAGFTSFPSTLSGTVATADNLIFLALYK